MRCIILAIALDLATTPAIAERPAPAQKEGAQKEGFFKRAGKQVGKDANTGWKRAKKNYSQSGKAAARDTSKAAKRVGQEIKQSSKRTAKAAKDTF
jgi:hypothetical protein